MAYARCTDDSDVYVYHSTGNVWVCIPYNTAFYHQDEKVFRSLDNLKLHLENHRHAGDRVPDRTFKRIEREMKDDC